MSDPGTIPPSNRRASRPLRRSFRRRALPASATAAVAAAMTLWTIGCSGRPPDPSELPDVVLVTLDTVRADRLGAYGYRDAATENLDALAAAGRVYESAYSPLPLTIPSHASLFTGTYPPALGIRGNGDGRLQPELETLAERLRDSGYATAASVAAFVTTRQWGFDQGFDVYHDDLPPLAGASLWRQERSAEAVVDDILAWRESADATGRPLFAWVHLYDAHAPYAPPDVYRDEVGDRPYQGEIAYIDDQLERLLTAFPEALFVVVGDHGEALGEHHEQTHGMFVYDATQRVPWILSGPGVEPERIEQPVSLVDVAPTLLDLLGLPPLADTQHGRVVPAPEGRPLYMESFQLQQRFGIAPHVAVVEDGLKLIDLPEPELYDLRTDPAEKVDLARDRSDDVRRLLRALSSWDFDPPGEDPAAALDPEAMRQLARLGYVTGATGAAPEGPLPDPKSRIAMLVKVQVLDQAIRRGELDHAAELLDELRAEVPEAAEFHTRRAALYARAGDLDAAVEVLREGLRQRPDSLGLKFALGTHHARTGRFREASLVFQEIAAAAPHDGRARADAVAALFDAGDRSEALALGLRYLETHPDDASVAGMVGTELVRRKRPEEAVPLLRRGMEAPRPERDVAYSLSIHEFASGDRDAARRLLEQELRFFPGNTRARQALVRILAAVGEWQALVDTTEVALRRESDVLDFWHANAQASFNLGDLDRARTVLDQALQRFPGASHLLLLDANLMVAEGRPETAARRRFEEARAARERELAEAPRTPDGRFEPASPVPPAPGAKAAPEADGARPTSDDEDASGAPAPPADRSGDPVA